MTPSHRWMISSLIPHPSHSQAPQWKPFFQGRDWIRHPIRGGVDRPLFPDGCLLNVTLESIRDEKLNFSNSHSRTSCFFLKSHLQDPSARIWVWRQMFEKKAAFVFQTTDQQEFFQINELLHTTSHSPRYSSGRASANPSPSPSATRRQISLSVNPLRSRSEIKLKPTTQN